MMKRVVTVVVFLAAFAVAGAIMFSLGRRKGTGRGAAPETAAPAAAMSSPLPTADWTIFRGDPGMLGVAGGKLPDAMKIRWKYKTNGEVTSSAVIAAGRVFIGSTDANVYCLDAASGRKVWSFATGDAVEAPPTCVDGKIYVGSSDTFLYCLDAASGKLDWKFEAGDRILGAASLFRDGAGGGTRILFGCYDFHLYCLAPADGNCLWKYKSDNYINGGIAVAGGKTVFGGCDAKIHVVSPDGNEAGTIDAGAYVAATPAFDGRFVYVGNFDGGLVCADTRTDKIAWSYRGKAPFFSSPAIGADRVVVGSRDYSLHCMDRKTGKGLWTFATRDEVNSSPVLCGGRVVFGSNDGRLYIVTLADGKKVWSYDLGDAVASSPGVGGGMVVVGCNDQYVYAFEAGP